MYRKRKPLQNPKFPNPSMARHFIHNHLKQRILNPLPLFRTQSKILIQRPSFSGGFLSNSSPLSDDLRNRENAKTESSSSVPVGIDTPEKPQSSAVKKLVLEMKETRKNLTATKRKMEKVRNKRIFKAYELSEPAVNSETEEEGEVPQTVEDEITECEAMEITESEESLLAKMREMKKRMNYLRTKLKKKKLKEEEKEERKLSKLESKKERRK